MKLQNSDDMADLLSDLRHSDKEHRAGCVQKIVQHGCETVPQLLPFLKDPDWKIRYRIAEALGLMKAQQAVPDLIETCCDEKDHVRYMAAKALGLIRTPDAVPALIRLLTDEHSYSRGIAAEGLGSIGDQGGKIAIESALGREKDPVIRDRMKKSLNIQ